MEYNSERSQLKIREFGRNVQNLVDHAKTIEDDTKRSEFVNGIIKLMNQMNPSMKNMEEFQQKLWTHVFFMANYDLDVPCPYPIASINRDRVTKNESLMTYPQSKFRYRQYGKNVQSMIESAKKIEDREKQLAYGQVIASYMKMVFRNWDNENVNDLMILNDLDIMSGGILKLDPETNINSLTSSTKKSTTSYGTVSKMTKPKRKGQKGRRSNQNNRGRRYKRN